MTANEQVERVADNPWFKFIGRSMMIAIVPVLGFVFTTLIEVKTNLRVLQITLETQKLALDAMALDRYRPSDAIRDQKLLQIQVDTLMRRIDNLERPLPRER